MNKDIQEPLYEQNGNNPPNLIGYVSVGSREIFTARRNPSFPKLPGYRGGWRDNRAHDKRVKASVSPGNIYRKGVVDYGDDGSGSDN